MKQSIYLETTIVSYYTSKPSRDIIVLAHQEITRQWWPMAIKRYDVYISEVVIEEAGFGDMESAKRRLEALKDFPHLELNDKVEEMAQIYMERLEIPEKSFRDAAHLAIASIHHIDYLVTWNCTHLANGEVIRKLMKINESFGVHTPNYLHTRRVNGGMRDVERPDCSGSSKGR
ncbi:MAG: type II toxin-antitoxin system VapC family toxin [Syntrophaceae bacterium]|nr:type II toxin-antitoxin system VapC family toxin [Syntrophaceae bacterium]